MYAEKSFYSIISVYIGNGWHLKNLAKPPEITETKYSTQKYFQVIIKTSVDTEHLMQYTIVISS